MNKMISYYIVSAIGIDRTDMSVETNEDGSLFVRDEVIDTNNEIFRGCENAYEVETRYETFWNRPRGVDDYLNPYIVKVVNVELVSDQGNGSLTQMSNVDPDLRSNVISNLKRVA
jgi:hypothetical protein